MARRARFRRRLRNPGSAGSGARTRADLWRARFGGMDVPDARRLRELEQENAKLKLLLPTLLKNMQIKGLDVTSIRVEVQVNSARSKPRQPVRKLSPDAAASLSRLANTLPESPLRTAIERLSKKG